MTFAHTVNVVCDGNSRTYGVGATHGVNDYPTQLEALLPAAWNVTNIGVGGENIDNMVARAAATDALLTSDAAANILIAWEACNQYKDHRTAVGAAGAAGVHASLAAYCAARKAAGWTVVVCTEITAQSEATRPSFDAFRDEFNELMRVNYPAYAHALIDLAADTRIGTLTAAQALADTTYFFDGTHLKPAGYAVVAELAYPVVIGLGVVPETRARSRRSSISLLVGSDDLGWEDLGHDAELGLMTRAMPGGDGSLDWTLGGDAAWKYRNVLVPGASVRLRVNGERIWGGRYVNDPLRHRLKATDTVDCAAGGLNSWLARHRGFAIPFVDSDPDQWQRVRQKESGGVLVDLEDQGKFTIDTEGRLYLRADGDRNYVNNSRGQLTYWLFNGLDLGFHIVGVDLVYSANLPGSWEFHVISADTPWDTTHDVLEWSDSTDRSGYSKPIDFATPNHAIQIQLYDSVGGSPASNPYVWVTSVKVYCRKAGTAIDRTITLGDALGEVATQTGFATVTDCDALSGTLGHLMVRPEFPKTAADALREIAGQDDDFVEYGFYLTDADEDAFFCCNLPDLIALDATRNHHWSYGGRPGEDADALARDSEAAADYLRLIYQSFGVAAIPDGQQRDVWHPSDPGSFNVNADVVTEYANTPLAAGDAAAFAERLWTVRQAAQWTGEIPFPPTARSVAGVDMPSWRVRPGDRVSVTSLEGASALYVAETSFDFYTMTGSATIGWPFDPVAMRQSIYRLAPLPKPGAFKGKVKAGQLK